MSSIKALGVVLFWAASAAATGYLVYFIFQFFTLSTLLSVILGAKGNGNENEFFGPKLALAGVMCVALFFVSVYKIIGVTIKLANGKPERT